MNTEEEKKGTPLSELGEFGLIQHLTKDIVLKNESSVKGVGDDAAILNYKNSQIILTTDLLVEGVHFDLIYTPLKHIGYKAAVVNFSDVYAMNGQPKQITVSIAVSNRFSVEALEELYAGIYLACEKYGVDMVGGDTSSSQKGLIISITAVGEAGKREIVYRHTAKKNDLICVSGDLGGAYMGLQLLKREKEVFKVNPDMQPELSGYEYIIGRQLKPEARKDIILRLHEMDVKPTSMIDISDGLSSEILHICRNSGMGCKLFEDKIPIHEETRRMANEFRIDPTICAMSGGEDYELLFTISLKDYERIKAEAGISIIGHISEEKDGVVLVARDGTLVPVTSQGWDAMLQKECT